MAQRLSFEERVRIEEGIRAGDTDSEIAARLGRVQTTITREIDRSCTKRCRYRAKTAQGRSTRRAKRPRPSRFQQEPDLAQAVQDRLGRRGSPHAIAADLANNDGRGGVGRVCAETIYQACYH